VSDRDSVHDLLVVVPGILGSRLRHSEHGLVWGAVGTLATLAAPHRLELSGDGFSCDPDVRPEGLVTFPLQLPGLWKIDAYTSLLQRLRERFVLDESNLIVFAYDWRLSCTINARLLAETIEPVLQARRRQNPEAKIVFIAHSMGGLIVQHFVDVLGGYPDTKRIITIGTPYRGAARALGAISRGAPRSVAVIRSRVRDLARTLPSVYELLPRYKAIIDRDVRRAMTVSDLPDGAAVDLFNRATSFHATLEAQPMRAYERTVVIGSLHRTAQFATTENGQVKLHNSWQQPDGTTLDRRGDGTVPRQSTTPADWETDADAIPYSQTHVALPGSDDLTRLLQQVLTAGRREDQGPQRAKLAIGLPDIAEAGTALSVTVEIPEGDHDIPMIVNLTPLNDDAPPPPQPPVLQDGTLIAQFNDLPPGDYQARVSPAILAPDVRPVWDLITIVDSSQHRAAEQTT
jgi:hypothetical protein